jgi:hypothetical protein
MTLPIGRFTPHDWYAAAAAVRPVDPTAARFPQRELAELDSATPEGAILGDVPPVPTDEARAMVDRAAERVRELYRENRQLHFVHDEETNRVVIEVRDLEGNLIKTIPPSKAMDVMAGAEL